LCRGATTIVLDGALKSSITIMRMKNGESVHEPGWGWTVLAAAASAWLLVALFLARIVGPLNPDEIYFSHTLWLTLQGKRQFLDFYSQHFPTYFALYDLLIPRERADSLRFIWFVRLSNIVVLGGYIAILFAVARRSAIFFLSLFLLIALISRMIEVRSDTLGLLAFNAGWVVLLVGKSRRSLALATVLAIVAVAFSARGLVMSVGFGAAVAWRLWVARDLRGLVAPAVLVGCAGLALLTAFLAHPRYAELMLQSTLFSPSTLLSRPSLSQRFLALDRLPQTLMAAVALLLAVTCLMRATARENAGIVAIACLTQLILIVVDPSPFPYVYAWAIVPSLVGLGLADRVFNIEAGKWIAITGALGGAAILSAVILYLRINGHEAPVGSNYRLFLDTPLQAVSIQQMSAKSLTALMLSGDQQQSLANQLLVREELCRRVNAPVLSAWQSHPICLPDATYYWFSITWPNIGSQGPPPKRERWFEEIFEHEPPSLVVWAVPGASTTLNPWAQSLLKGYDVEKGFAIRADLTEAMKDNSGRAATPPNNDHS
jgi:hypothetical protein